MGFWNKFGQIALQAAPYVAAPFTGGMSLSAAPLTGKLANKLEDKSDKAEFEKTGVAPSRSMMNKIMGGVNAAAGMYGGAKIAGKIGGGSIGNDMPSQGGITGTMGKGGLSDFARQFAGQQLSGGNGGILNNVGAPPTPQPVMASLPNTGGAEIPRQNPNLGAAVARGKSKVYAGY